MLHLLEKNRPALPPSQVAVRTDRLAGAVTDLAVAFVLSSCLRYYMAVFAELPEVKQTTC